jgi:hypothetical protein
MGSHPDGDEEDDNSTSSTSCIRIYISGDRSQVGKSSVCMGLLGSFLQLGYPPETLGYIKPATQCEAIQPVTNFCQYHGIDTVPVSPIIYYAGFTREYLAGRTAETSTEMLHRVSHVVDALAHDKRILIIDGVGYPSVGSITGTSNAHIAIACGYPVIAEGTTTNTTRIPAPVLIVGKSGVGDAVDSFNLNATYFEYHNVTVLGAIFNRLSLDEGFYSLPNCKKAVEQYFQQNFEDTKTAFGFIPEIKQDFTPSTLEQPSSTNSSSNNTISEELKKANSFVFTFMKYVNVLKIISAARKVQQEAALTNIAAAAAAATTTTNTRDSITSKTYSIASTKGIHIALIPTLSNSSDMRIPLTREQIEAAARGSGAKAR